MKVKLFIVAVFIVLSTSSLLGVDFTTLRGSELLIGSGAEQVGRSGAGIAVSSNSEALYWNPAGISFADDIILFGSANPLQGANDFTLVIPGNKVFFLPNSISIAGGYLTRLRFRGDSGDDLWEGFANHLLEMAMLDLGDDFQGKIDSRTADYRLAVSWKSPDSSLKLGTTICYLF